jgi:broad specificity phosphatase PhoE
MKPKNIFIVRHGESEGNADKSIYNLKPDYTLLLTPKGVKEAKETGIKLYGLIGAFERFAVYYSPYFRARQTTQKILNHFEDWQYAGFVRMEPYLREQEWSRSIRPGDPEMKETQTKRDIYGHFLFGFPEGESCADVYDRAGDMITVMHRDFEKPNFPENVLLSTHGMYMRVFVMRWFHMSIEEFEQMANPNNGEIWQMQLDKSSQKYELITKIRLYDKTRCEFPYPFGVVGA